jgi:hypothetical protein
MRMIFQVEFAIFLGGIHGEKLFKAFTLAKDRESSLHVFLNSPPSTSNYAGSCQDISAWIYQESR